MVTSILQSENKIDRSEFMSHYNKYIATNRNLLNLFALMFFPRVFTFF